MAGEWLKFETSTPEKTEVFAITVALGWDDPDLTVGKLLKVWRWFDQHTIEGNAVGVTLSLLDRISGVSGFAQAMCDVGWLEQNSTGLSLPHFDRHNGKTAKDRALTAKRVANHKANKGANDEGNAASVTSALPREEKRREEKNIKPKSKADAPTATASRLPDTWQLSKDWGDWAMQAQPTWTSEHVRLVADKFRDYWAAVPGAKGRKIDWLATWRNWCRNEKPLTTNNVGGGKGPWWATDASVIAKGEEMQMRPLAGESMQTFKGRIQVAIDSGGRPPPIQPSAVTPMPSMTAKRSVKPDGLSLTGLLKNRGGAHDLP